MKITRIPALVAAVVVVGTSVLIGAPANAETSVGDAVFYGESDFGHEGGGSYPTNDWFFGEVSGTEGSHSFGPTGLKINGGTPGLVQILNQDVVTPDTALDLTNVINDVSVYADSVDWTFQLPLFSEGNADFTTLRPSAPGVTDSSVDWITSGAITGFAAGAQAPLADLLTAVYGGTAPTLLGYGLFFDATDAPTVQGIVFDNVGSGFSFVPTRTFTPASISTGDLADPAKGITLTGTNWIPGSFVYVEIFTDSDTLFQDLAAVEVGVDGSFTYTLVAADVPAGTYGFYFDDDNYLYGIGALPRTTLEVVADAPVLAETGVDASGALMGGAALLLLGGLSVAFTIRRKATA